MRGIIEQCFQIAYYSNGAIGYNDISHLPTEERNIVMEILSDLKKKEKKEMEKASKKNTSTPSSPNKYSSLSSRMPRIPKM